MNSTHIKYKANYYVLNEIALPFFIEEWDCL